MEYISETLGINVIRKKWNDKKKLPYFLIDEYDFQYVLLDSIECIFISPKENLPVINTLKKHITAINKIAKMPIVIELIEISRQKHKSLIENRIPFIVTKKHIYLPFMGIAIQEKYDAEQLKRLSDKLIPSAQMLLFAFIYGNCEPISVSDMAKKLNITSMSALRATNQLVAFNLLYVKVHGRSKIICSEFSKKELFNKAKPYLINPIRKIAYIEKSQIDDTMFASGISALSKLSMLSVSNLCVFGTADNINKYTVSEVLLDTDKQYKIEFWKYDTALLGENNCADILSLAVCLEDTQDERTEIVLEELFKKVWSNK